MPTDKDLTLSRYVCIDFTFDSRYIICVSGEPDWTLFCFKCDVGRLESFAKANNANGTGTVLQVKTTCLDFLDQILPISINIDENLYGLKMH